MISSFEDDDIRKIVELLGQYFDGLYEGDTKKFESVFHKDSHLYSSDGVEIAGAELEKGLLNIFLVRKTLEPKVKTIKITARG